MQLILKHNTTNFKHYYDWVVIEESTPLHTQINLNLSLLEDGEYTLSLFNDAGMPLATELIRIGDYQIKDYKTTKQFKHYARK